MSTSPVHVRRQPWRRVLRALAGLRVGFMLLGIGWVRACRFVDPPLRALMLERRIEAWHSGGGRAACVRR